MRSILNRVVRCLYLDPISKGRLDYSVSWPEQYRKVDLSIFKISF